MDKRSDGTLAAIAAYVLKCWLNKCVFSFLQKARKEAHSLRSWGREFQ
jgi:hypothetical protein